MAPLQQFIRWLKDKTGHEKDETTKIRKLPPIPDGYEYGFKRHDDASSHIYEEIIYDVPMTDLNTDYGHHAETNEKETKFMTDTKQQLDFSDAKTVGPYLVVPIRTSTVSKKSDRHNLDLIADLENGDCDARKIESSYQSLYNMMPDWAKEHLNVSARSREGLAVPRGYSVDEPPSKQHVQAKRRTREEVGDDIRQQNSESGTFIVHRTPDGGKARSADGEARTVSGNTRTAHGNTRTAHGSSRTAHGNIRIQNPSESQCNITKQTVNGSRIATFDTIDDYEYFLVKTQKNLRIEQELRDYLNGTPATCMMATDSLATITEPVANEEDTRDVLIITKRDVKAKKSPGRKERQRIERSQLKSCHVSSERVNERYQRAADALFDQIYSSVPCDPCNPSRDTTGLVSESSAFHERRSRENRQPKRTVNNKESSTTSDLSKFSCRVTSFQLEAKRTRVKTPHPRICHNTEYSSDTSSDEGIYQHRQIADNHIPSHDK